ncbi:unnamed protein product [Coregonus sp. 'balchen']|nr:unnamed protein product [Coregonus sp. 'balchen']
MRSVQKTRRTPLCPVESEGLAVTGLVGGQVEIKCSHRFTQKNIKDFCKDTCTGSDILVQTEDSKNYIERGRYSIDDRGDGDFTVIINDPEDSGTYGVVFNSCFNVFKTSSLTTRPHVLFVPPAFTSRETEGNYHSTG